MQQQQYRKPEGFRLAFSLEAVSKSASAFNTDKLLWLNHHYINQLPASYVATHLQRHIEQQIDTRNDPQLAEAGAMVCQLRKPRSAGVADQHRSKYCY